MNQSIRQAVMQASQQWIADFNSGNFAACLARYQAKATMSVSPFGRFEGIEQISSFWTEFAKSAPAELVYRNVQIKVLNEKQAVLSANWSMNIASGFISKELWSLANDGQWYLQEDDFSVLTQLEQPLEKAERTALVLVDLQNDYYSGGKFELQGIDAATEQARILLTHFRAHDLPVIHIQHIFKDSVAPFFNENTHGIEIETRVAPLDDEPVIVKHAIDSFTDTDLEQTLVKLGIEKLVVVGAMAQACVQTICRTATHKGYECEVIADAIAAPQLTHPVQDFSGEQLVAANLISLSFGGAQAYSLHDWLSKYAK